MCFTGKQENILSESPLPRIVLLAMEPNGNMFHLPPILGEIYKREVQGQGRTSEVEGVII